MTAFPFLQLPRELRDHIYYYCLTNYLDALYKFDAFAIIRRVERPSYSTQIRSCIGLLGTCRQVRYEASPYFYDRNDFYFSAELLHRLLCDLRNRRIQHSENRRIQLVLPRISSMTIFNVEFIPVWGSGVEIFNILDELSRQQNVLKRLHLILGGAIYKRDLRRVVRKVITLANEVQVSPITISSSSSFVETASMLKRMAKEMGCKSTLIDMESESKSEHKWTRWIVTVPGKP